MTGQEITEDFDVGAAIDKLEGDSSDEYRDITNPIPDTDTITQVSFDSVAEIEPLVEQVWPAPEFRKYQKEAIVEILKALYIEDNDVVTLSAPTGAGKSLIIYAATKVISAIEGAKSYVTTPLNTLIDQIQQDDFITDITTLKGKNNYNCVHHEDRGKPVNNAICQREDTFECSLKERFPEHGGCPYYGRKKQGRQSNILVTNLSYLMANALIPEGADVRFSPRNLLAIDEVQSVESFALNFIGFTIDRRSIPINFKPLPPMPDEGCEMDEMVSWLKEVLTAIIDRQMVLNTKPSLTETESNDEDKLKRLNNRINNFIQDYDNNEHWTKTRDGNTVKFEPVFIDRFVGKYLWSQSEKVLLSSATIPKGDFLDAIGLSDKDTAHITVPSTFPTENRPVITREMVGKMTKSERDQTIPKLADKLAEIADFHRGENGFVHCNSYTIMERIYDHLPPEVQARTMMQDSDDRMGSLNEWVESDDQVFLSVAMDEGISLDDEKARWQVIAKASYPFMGDERVNYRVNKMGDWNWYANQAIINLQQAVGRGMRSKDDWCVTYLLDSSFKNLLDKNEDLFEGWFLDSVDCRTDLDTYSSTDTNFSFSS